MCIFIGSATYTDRCICDGMCELHYWSQCSTIMFDTIMPKFGRNSDQASTPQCRSLVAVWCRSLVDRSSNSLCCSLIYRATFDQTSTLGVLRFGRSLAEVSTLGGRSLVEISTELRPPVSKFGRNLCQASTPQYRIYAHINFKTSL